jgi:HAD superfamily hydrolase (TIGR01509 family)
MDYYDILQNTVGGGKPKMWYYFTNTTGNVWPSMVTMENISVPPPTTKEQEALIDQLQSWKTVHYQTLLEQEAVARPGVVELLDQALGDPKIAVGVCSAATREAAAKTLALTLGADRVAQLDVCLLGDDVSAKKPDPLIYTTAAAQVGVDPTRCIVVEDSLIGVQAAVAAGMTCIVTYTSSTEAVDFYTHGAAAKMSSLANVSLEALFGPWRNQGLDAEILVDIRDGPLVDTSGGTATTIVPP